MTNPMLIPADAVRVWRGFQAPAMQLADFLERLNTVFVPATVQMQIDVGLDGYVPTVPAGLPDKPATVPDETAVLFWDSQQTYRDGFGTLAVRTYTLTHAAVYTPASRADFPLAFTGTMTQDQPYHLKNDSADWMHGHVTHFLGARPDGTPTSAFLQNAAAAVGALAQANDLLGGIACAGADYVAAWVLTQRPHAGQLDPMAKVADWSQTFEAAPTRIPAGLWEQWAGLTVQSGDSLNMQFTRRWER